MSENTTTEQAAPDALDTEARARADAWQAQKAAALKLEVHHAFGYSDSVVAREMEKVDYARARLDLSDDAVHEAERLLGTVGALEVGARWGDALSSLPPSLTPEQAHEEIRDLKASRTFYERLASGDRAAHRLWDGLHALAARRRQ